jgi:hypothetical protein
MNSPEKNLDSTLESTGESWPKLIFKPYSSTSLGNFFVGMFILFWSSSLTELFGYDHRHGYGGLIFSAVGLTLTFGTMYINTLMKKIGLDRSVRSALWLSAVIGSYVALTTYPWGLPIFSEIAGFISSILTFLISYQFDKKFGAGINQK